MFYADFGGVVMLLVVFGWGWLAGDAFRSWRHKRTKPEAPNPNAPDSKIL